MREKTVTFLVKSVRANRLAVPGDTTIAKLRAALEAGGYDVEDANIRIIRNGRSFIGHVKNVLLHDNDVVVFKTEDMQMRVSQDLQQKHNASDCGCTPECFDETNDISIEDFLDSLTPEQQRKATIYLNLLWAKKEGAKVNG